MASKKIEYDYDPTDEIVMRAIELPVQEVVKKIKAYAYKDDIAQRIIEILESEIENAIVTKIRDDNVYEWYNPNTGKYNDDAEKKMIEAYRSCGKTPSERIGVSEGLDDEKFHKYLLFLAYGYEILSKKNSFYSNRLRSLFSKNSYVSKDRLIKWSGFLNNDNTARYLASFIVKNCNGWTCSFRKISESEEKNISVSFFKIFPSINVEYITIDVNLLKRKKSDEIKFKNHIAVTIRNKDGLKFLKKRDSHALVILLLLYKHYIKDGEYLGPTEIFEWLKKYVPDSALKAVDLGRVISKLKKELKIFGMSVEGKYIEGWKVFLPSGVDIFCNTDILRHFFEG